MLAPCEDDTCAPRSVTTSRERAAARRRAEPAVRVLVAGATGFVGRALTASLGGQGHEVTALTRHPEDYRGSATPAAGDVQDEETRVQLLAGRDAAYYLVHSLAEADFDRSRPITRWRKRVSSARAVHISVELLGSIPR